SITRVEQLDGYKPAIPLLAEPGVCMTLVPADKALALARAVKREYEKQMGRVRDRLPLDLGLVFFRRRTPIRAVLEAGRSMLDMGSSEPWEGWRLVTKDDTSDPSACKLVFDNGITWWVLAVAGDGKKDDEWYPNIYQGFVQRDAKPTWVKNLQLDPPKGR